MIKLETVVSTDINCLVCQINEEYSSADDVQIIVENGTFCTYYTAIVKYRSKTND